MALSPIAFTTSAPGELGRSTNATRAPAFRNRSAVARPSPDAAPVTNATLDANDAIVVVLGLLRGRWTKEYLARGLIVAVADGFLVVQCCRADCVTRSRNNSLNS